MKPENEGNPIIRYIGKAKTFFGCVIPMLLLAFVPPFWAYAIRGLEYSTVTGDQRFYEQLPRWLMPVYASLCFCFVFCAILKTVAAFDRELEEKFCEFPMSVGLRDELSLIFRHRPFLVRLAVTEASYIILFAVVASRTGSAWFYAVDAAVAAALPVLFAVSYLAACNAWNRDRIRMRGGGEERRRRFAGRLLISLLPTLIVTFMIVDLLPNIFQFRFVIFPVAVYAVPAAILIFVGIRLWRYAGALLRRRTFLRELRDACRECGFELSEIKKPFLSAVRMTDGESFRVSARGRTYVCKLVGVPKKRDPLTVYDDGTCIITHSVRLRGYTFFSTSKSYDISFDAGEGERKIFIFNPVPALLLARRGGGEAPVDVGDSVGAYKLYSGTPFINALRRDTLDR